ncbi:MAG: NADH-quinone oxidoreductase subunit N, partial [Desulfobulbus propionicus]
MTLLPELVLIAGALFYFIISLQKSPAEDFLRRSMVIVGALVFLSSCAAYNAKGQLFSASYQVDLFSQFFKVLIGFGFAAVSIFGQHLRGINREVKPEYSLFLCLSVLGLMMLVSSVELITIFVSLELSSFALYLLVPLREDRTGLRVQMEAGIKYILFGVMATGFMLYGMSYVFGLTGSTHLREIIPALEPLATQPVVFVAVLLILSGFLFKLAVFPMHFWVPDIYQGASNETTAFVATVPKLGAVALLIRFLTLPNGHPDFLEQIFCVLAVCSMFYGNLSALVQKDIKRILGFSGISHAGFIMLGLMTFKADGFGLAVYYITGYVLMNLACFLVICHASKDGENLEISDLAGLHKKEPLLSFILAVSLFALAGIPPFVGFMGKFFLLTGTLQQGHLWIVILAAVNTAIAIYYYLSIVKAAYTDEAVEEEGKEGKEMASDTQGAWPEPLIKATGACLVVFIILMGAFPSKLV